MTLLDEIDASSDVVSLAAIVLVVACAIVVNVVLPILLRFLTRRAVRRATAGRGRWRLRLPRVHDSGRAEQRRVQRADAAAHMMSRVSSLAVFTAAAVVVSRILGMSPVVLLSSAGFLGAGLAIGGQSLIKDWITGLLVLLEDRYAVGDSVIVTVGANEVSGTVETLGGAGLRLRLDDGTTWHTGHGSVESVTNQSQQLVAHTIELPLPVWSELDETMLGRDLNAASHDLGLTDVLLVSEIAAQRSETGTQVVVRASRPLTKRQQQLIADRIVEWSGAASGAAPPSSRMV